MVSPVQNGFQQQFQVNRSLNTGAAQQTNPQDQQPRNPVEDVNNEVGSVNETQGSETQNTASANSTNNIASVETNRDNSFLSTSSSDRGNTLDITV